MDEVPDLDAYLLSKLDCSETVIADEVMNMLMNYSWPGNIRELKNVLERALLLSRGEMLRPLHFSGLGSEHHAVEIQLMRTVQEVEESHIVTALEQANGNIEKAARTLNLSRATLYRRLKQIKVKTALIPLQIISP